MLSPLVVSLFNATRSLDAITIMNENSIADVVTITRFNRDVSEALVDMERVSRQYQLLGEEGLVSVFQKKLELLFLTSKKFPKNFEKHLRLKNSPFLTNFKPPTY